MTNNSSNPFTSQRIPEELRIPVKISYASKASFIEVHNVSQAFDRAKHHAWWTDYVGGPPVLHNVDLAVAKDEFAAIIGPSGCGKSTLLNILAGLIKPTSGTVKIDNVSLASPRHSTSMVFQAPGLMPWKTVRDNVLLSLRLKLHRRLRTADKAMANHYIELVGLSQWRNAYPRQLSGGMQQRVGLARALVTEPDLLLMDEPFGALDAQTRKYMQDELQRLCAAYEATVVLVTHDIDEAIRLADRIIVMNSQPGRIVSIEPNPLGRTRGEYDVELTDEFRDLRARLRSLLTPSKGE